MTHGQSPHPPSARCEDRVGEGWRHRRHCHLSGAERRSAGVAERAAPTDDVDLHGRRFTDAEQGEVVEAPLHDRAALDRDLLMEAERPNITEPSTCASTPAGLTTSPQSTAQT
jgi:hypothetical protein